MKLRWILVCSFLVSLLLLATFRLGMKVGDPHSMPGEFYRKWRMKISVAMGDEPPGRFKKFRGRSGQGADLSDLDKLGSLPYLQGSVEAPEESDVGVYVEGEAEDGLNLVLSGHKPSAFLMDMRGEVLHEWSVDFGEVWPEGIDFFEHESHKKFWRRAHVFKNGDILAIFEGIGILKLDKDSNIIWKNKCRAHHDIFIGPDSMIYTLTQAKTRVDYDSEYDLGIDEYLLENFIAVLTPDGQLVKSVSVLKCYLNSDYASVLDLRLNDYDILHTNTIEIVDDSDAAKAPIYREGLFLISTLSNNTIALVDLDQERVTWAMSGLWKAQHQPTILDNGNILVFDNQGRRERSKVVEVDPLTKEVVWAYRGTDQEPFYTFNCGSSQRLPKGNTLITESNNGRAFEVTPEGEIVWEYLNPHRAGENGELIATLLEVVRIAPGDLDFDFNKQQ